MPFDEAQLNGRIAGLIRHQTKDIGWHVREEAKGVFLDHRLAKPDIVIRRDDAPPVIIENEYVPGSTLEQDCLSRLGFRLEAHQGGKGGLVSVVFALRSPGELRECETGDEAEAKLRIGVNLEFAVYRGKPDSYSRFPASGFLRGEIRDLVNFIKPASIPEDIVARSADSLTHGANEAATILVRHSERTSFGAKLGDKLRQPWPAFADIPKTRSEMRQANVDADARLQTAKMCATMLINACAYQQNLSNHHDDINDLATARDLKGRGELSKSLLLDEWKRILAINYWPIFHIARELLLDLPTEALSEMLPGMIDTANDIQAAMRQNDIAGIVFQRLIADRKTLKTYYTRPESTVLVAHLGVHDDIDWSNPDRVRNYRIADYACGTGGLLLAAYQRVREQHRSHGGNPDRLHPYIMEHSLTACDIMPAAVHLSSSLLSSVAPSTTYDGTRHILFGFGGVKRRDRLGQVIKDTNGNPVLECDAKGRPIVNIGSLDLLDLKSTKRQVVLPINEQMALGPRGKRSPIEVEMSPLSQDLVIMNPPFTRPTKHARRNANDHVDPRNPVFAAFGTTDAEQCVMKKRGNVLRKNTISDGHAGLGSTFAAIAEIMVKSGGRIAMILPLSAMVGGSWDGDKIRSWQKLRRMLANSFNDIVVVSICDPKPMEFSFSADTSIGEIILVARRLRGGEHPSRTAHFVNLTQRPASTLVAQELARAVRRVVSGLTEPATHEPIMIGEERFGFVSLEAVDPLRKWTAVRLANERLYRSVSRLTCGELTLPQSVEPVRVPIVRLGEIGKVGPVHRNFDNAFTRTDGVGPGTEFPFLWSHDADVQYKMIASPDSSGELRPGQEENGMRDWKKASHLHISCEVAFNSNPTAAVFTKRMSAGGRAWPNVQMMSVDFERATCAWFNSTLGMMCFWIESNRTQGSRGGTTVTAIPNIATLDLRALPLPRVSAAVKIFDDLCEERLLPTNEAYRDPVRQELDRRILTEVLAFDDEVVEQFAILRNQWCAEPSVTGVKETSIQFSTHNVTA